MTNHSKMVQTRRRKQKASKQRVKAEKRASKVKKKAK